MKLPRPCRSAITVVALSTVAALVGCDTPPEVVSASGRWTCPAAWVASSRGGCGPAALLCVAGGEAAPGVCASSGDAGTFTTPRGASLRAVHRLPDGGFAGAWVEAGDPSGPPRDGWTPEDPSGVPSLDHAPAAGIGACAAGWRRLEDGTCDAALRAVCEPGAMAVPGGACTATGASACGAGAYADPGSEADGATVFRVRAGASPDGADGSAARPFPSIGEALARAPDALWVLVAAGDYRERVRVAAGHVVHLVGTCAARVSVRGEGEATLAAEGVGAVLDLRGVTVSSVGVGALASGGAELRAAHVALVESGTVGALARDASTRLSLVDSVVRGVRELADPRVAGVAAVDGAELTVTGSAIADNVASGVIASGAGARVELRSSVVRGSRARADGTDGLGVGVNAGASALLDGSLVVDTRDAGIFVHGRGATIDLRASSVRRSAFGDGAVLDAGATLRATDTLFADCGASGVFLSDGDTRAELTRCVVRGARPRLTGSFGRGVEVDAGASLVATAVTLDDNVDVGVRVGRNARATLRGVVARGTRAHDDGSFGRGVEATEGASLTADDVLLVDNDDQALFATGARTRVTLTGGVLRGTCARGVPSRGRPIEVNGGATLRVEGALLAEGVGVGLVVDGRGSEVEVTASEVRDTCAVADDDGGGALRAQNAAVLRAEAVRMIGNARSGVVATGAKTRAFVTGCLVRGTVAPPDTLVGAALIAAESARLEVRRTTVDAVWGSGVTALGAGTYVEVDDSVVRGARRAREGRGGAGLAAGGGAALVAARALIVDNAFCGAVSRDVGTRVDLGACVVRGPSEGAAADVGVLAQRGGVVSAEATSIGHNLIAGAAAVEGPEHAEGTTLELFGCLVQQTAPNGVGLFGQGVAVDGATFRAAGSMIADVFEAGVLALGQRGDVTLDDVVMRGVSPSGRGLGVGVFVGEGARLEGHRVALERVSGAGLVVAGERVSQGARARLEDLFVRDVRTSTTRFAEGPTALPEGRAVAYGLHVGRGCALDAARALLAAGGHGFFNAEGALRIDRGVIIGQLDAAGATSQGTPVSATTLVEVRVVGNARDSVVRSADLPTASSIGAPTTFE